MSNSFAADWARLEEANAEANRLNKTIVFDALSNAGITHVRVGFDGEGDQGQMERAVAQTNGNEVECPPVKLTLRLSQFGRDELVARELDLRNAVEQLCYDFLEQKHAGWENNEGCFGEFTFDVEARTITLEHYGRIIETAYSSDTF
jgi:hypothetical protein